MLWFGRFERLHEFKELSKNMGHYKDNEITSQLLKFTLTQELVLNILKSCAIRYRFGIIEVIRGYSVECYIMSNPMHI